MDQDKWIEVRIASSVDAGEVLAQLSDPAVKGAWQEQDLIRLYWPVDKWNLDVLNDLRSVLNELGHGELENRVTIDQLADGDWNELWARSVEPLRIGRHLVVRPGWHPVVLQPGDVELVIDPKQAFGTGHHATTQLLVEWLEDVIRKGDRVLDVGTGSGILAMAALRLGAAQAMGLDTDQVAIDCARDYAALNGFLTGVGSSRGDARRQPGSGCGASRSRIGEPRPTDLARLVVSARCLCGARGAAACVGTLEGSTGGDFRGVCRARRNAQDRAGA